MTHDGDARLVVQTSCYLFALVIAAFPSAHTGNGYWYDGVDAIEEVMLSKMVGDHIAQQLTQMWLAVVFQIVDKLTAV